MSSSPLDVSFSIVHTQNSPEGPFHAFYSILVRTVAFLEKVLFLAILMDRWPQCFHTVTEGYGVLLPRAEGQLSTLAVWVPQVEVFLL